MKNDLTTLAATDVFHLNVMVVDNHGRDVRERKTVTLSSNDVASVYSGKNGCMCGCNGNHRYHPGHVEYSSKDRGYEVTPREVSLLSVKRMAKKFACLSTDTVKMYNGDDSILFTTTDTRTNTIYLKK